MEIRRFHGACEKDEDTSLEHAQLLHINLASSNLSMLDNYGEVFDVDACQRALHTLNGAKARSGPDCQHFSFLAVR